MRWLAVVGGGVLLSAVTVAAVYLYASWKLARRLRAHRVCWCCGARAHECHRRWCLELYTPRRILWRIRSFGWPESQPHRAPWDWWNDGMWYERLLIPNHFRWRYPE